MTTNSPRPRLPLQSDFEHAITSLPPTATHEDVMRLRREFNERRDREFVGWRERYEKEMREWMSKE